LLKKQNAWQSGEKFQSMELVFANLGGAAICTVLTITIDEMAIV